MKTTMKLTLLVCLTLLLSALLFTACDGGSNGQAPSDTTNTDPQGLAFQPKGDGTSGGGACSVQFTSLADGSLMQISSPHHLCVVSNGAYYTVDRGVEPHHFFGKTENYYNRELLTAFINSLQ